MRERESKLYISILSQILRREVDFAAGALDRSRLISGLDVRTESPSGLVAHLGEICLADSLRGKDLLFTCDTSAGHLINYHLLKVTDVQTDESVPIWRRGLVLNREIRVFADLIFAFLQGLCNYAFSQESLEELAHDYGVPVQGLPDAFAVSLEEWMSWFNLPDIGTQDLLGRYMRHVYNGALELDGKPLVRK